MTWACYVDDVQIVLLDQPIEVDVDEIQPRCGSPVTQQTRLDVCDFQRLTQQRIGIEIDLPHGKIVCRAPVGMHLSELILG